MNRGDLKSLLRIYLGTSDDDPAFDDDKLDPIIQQARDSLIADINQTNPDYLSKIATLAADSSASHLYTFAGQSGPIIDFASWLEVRYTNEDGTPLSEARAEELSAFGSDYFRIMGVDEVAVLQTSKDSPAGTPLFFRYSYWPPDFADDDAPAAGVPGKFHDVVALEALFAYGLGGEQRCPPELRERWINRKAQMLARVGRRGVQPARTRVVAIE